MAPLASASQNRMVESIHQSPPVDCTLPYDTTTLRGKTILLTGGASGLGAAFARNWAAAGANLIIGDIADADGEALVAELRTANSSSSSSNDNKTSSSQHHHFIHVDVTSWPSQAALFQEAVRLSPTGELDAVVASAGISDKFGTITGKGFENPVDLDKPNPPAPNLKCIEVNLIGVMYTAHLALFWLQQNAAAAATTTTNNTAKEDQDTRDSRDRHLLLIGSGAGLFALPGVPEYVTSKHGVTGLFRSLRMLSYRQGIRVNMLCPYFVDTPILPNRAVAMLAGLGLATLEDTVDGATRLMAATTTTTTTTTTTAAAAAPTQQAQRIAGRALFIGPRASLLQKVLPERELTGDEEAEVQDVTGEVLVDGDVAAGKGQGVWDVYAHDYETADYFIRRYVRVLNTIAAIKGWIGFWKEFVNALFFRKDKSRP